MTDSEFTALQVTVLVRSRPEQRAQVTECFDSVDFQYQMQDELSRLLKEKLAQADVSFEEVIISLDQPAQRAKQSRTKSSFFDRLLGKS